ncbi:hypothetical protein FQN54_001064 [Arachnomyces sp. PD_36]|nr:hypothetical protein FQN54_001064 [Arachnomyces sp. PD_36]
MTSGYDSNIEVDSELNDDSSYEDDVNSTYTASLSSSVVDYPEKHGRRYHAYHEGRYLLPNDEEENSRLDIVHAMTMFIMENKLFLAPIGKNPQRVLDLCTGTGIWAIEFADEFPSAEVIGNDLSPIQPSLVPPNLKFIVDDVESPWGYEDKPFDYVHARFLVGGIKDMPRLVQQSYNCVKPGGWVEFQDWDSKMHSADGSLDGTMLNEYFEQIIPAFKKAGYDIRHGRNLEEWVKATGFENIQVKKYLVPLGTWPKDKRQKKIGALNYHQFDQTLEGSALAALTSIEGWRAEEVNVFAAKVRTDMKNPKIHGYLH